jgi:hypothetical protein
MNAPASKKILFSFVILYTLISHLILPAWNRSNDFLFFKSWRMYSGKKINEVTDITWDDGKTFLFRDHRLQASAANIDIYSMFHALLKNEKEVLRTIFKEKLKVFCRCDSLYIVRQNNSIQTHIIQKKDGPELWREAL